MLVVISREEYNMITSNQAYYMGRNSVSDNGKLYYKMAECSEINTPELVKNFKEGVRDIKGELKLNADTEWDGENE
jgi:hypothetical protein